MSLEDDFREAIDKNIPQEVGVVLKQRLQQAEDDAKRRTQLEREVKELGRLQGMESSLRSRTEEVKTREGVVGDNETALKIREAVLEVKEKCNERNRTDLFTVVMQVFKGPPGSKLAFDLYGNLNNLNTAMGFQNPNVSLSGSAETKDEG